MMKQSFSFLKQPASQYLRHFIQILVLLFLNAKLFQISATPIVVPFLHATHAPFSTAVGVFDAFESSITSGNFPILAVGIILITGVTIGKLLCAWACPFGFVQDLLNYLPISNKNIIPRDWFKSLQMIKQLLLAFSVFSSVLYGFQTITEEIDPIKKSPFHDAPFSVLSPSTTLFTYIPWAAYWKPEALYKQPIAYLKLSILIACLGLCVVIPRFFCRYICPLGYMYDLTNKFKFLKIKTGTVKKEEANKTLKEVCPMDVQISTDDKYIDSPACNHCGKCFKYFPNQFSQEFF
ncbi:ferredoxin-type protein naph [Anaeramoeba flamelloides]|uniref:Ferredoxin-type protein naph n=1 Tax=Anaeramoeba flamelloides TaxID=1746091 RepID=A0AAV7Z541_9EUKA|nr:ferredoxin-type protein naph [Anaeramoeba flamelloides]KAJ6247640.1 ferredoxin-type protein naph [Anaeramoeba flamelloides]